MKLVTYQFRGQGLRLGALWNDRVVDLNRADAGLPSDMVAFLEKGDAAMAAARSVLAGIARADAAALERRGVLFSLAEVQLWAPVPKPPKLICIGLNYRDHAKESNAAIPTVPIFFAKFTSAIVGPGHPIVLPRGTEQVDYEAEMAFVIGRRGKYIPKEKALEHVAGYTIVNDVSARDWQFRSGQWMAGKTSDTFAPMGPVLATPDEVPGPQAMDIKLSVGGEVLQNSNTRELIFSVEELIADLSSLFTLEPGDVVATGTTSGVGAARNPKRWLRQGDVVRIELQGVGVLENPVVKEE